MRKFANNQIVFVNGTYNQEEKCIIIDCIENEPTTGKTIYNVHSLDNYGTFGTTEDRVFATKEEAHKASIEASAKLVGQYKAEIKTLKDLLEFPLKHCISGGEEYTNNEAEQAYRLRMHELTGY